MGKQVVRYLIDSNVWIEAVANLPHAVRAMRCAVGASWTGYSAITRLELFGYPDLTSDEENHLRELLVLFVEVAVTSDVIDTAIAIRRGRRIRVPDALIAATALRMECELITRNVSDFSGISGLSIVDPVLIQE